MSDALSSSVESGAERVAFDRGRRAPAPPVRRARRWLFHRGIRLLLLLHGAALRVASLVGPRARTSPSAGFEILVTGTFYADNWIAAHLRPLAASRACARLRVVSVYPMPPIDKVEWVPPPPWLRRLAGDATARMLHFVWMGLTTRPGVVGGFHLLLNGLVAALLGRAIGARSLYFCGGGPTEVLDGGVWGENRLFRRMETPDLVVERQLLRVVGNFDHVITMGRRAITFFRGRGVNGRFHVVSGGMDIRRFAPGAAPATTDLVFVARLSRVKRCDIFMEAVSLVARQRPAVTATVVGEGPLLEDLREQARLLGLEDRIRFVGHQRDVEKWLQTARVFVLTSESEGLSLALMEAMLCGLPAVVSDVGDLPELVDHGVNGYLVAGRTPEAFAERILHVLEPDRLRDFSLAARRSAERYDLGATAGLWDEILGVAKPSGAS